ncbi:MAG: hypothetical protein K8R59_01890 [Thermoanaerobaculales bacterium]|nr:hypothetical protein [Thermoanaerobaculales bacterium]
MKVLFVVFGLLVAVAPVGAQLVDNGTFDSTVDGWDEFPKGTIVWDPLDISSSSSSGSALITNESLTSGDASGPQQCVTGIVGGQEYLVEASVYFPGSQSQSGWTRLLIRWYSDICFGTQLGLDTTPKASTPDMWSTTGLFVEAPTGAVAVALRLDVWKVEAGGALSAHFDNMILDGVVFRDDFESENLDAWSEVVP